MSTPISTDDWVALSNLLGRYCWLVDAGDGEGWAGLWLPDGVFTGVSPEPIVGFDALCEVPRQELETFKGLMRHQATNLYAEYGADADEVNGTYYNLVTEWAGGGKFFCMATCKVVFVRTGAGWKIKTIQADLMV